MKKRRKTGYLFALLFLLLLPWPAFAGVEFLSEQEFSDLAGKVASKVSLFREIWSEDPQAEFYGGTTRDYLYWLRGKFRGASSREEAVRLAKELLQEKYFDSREFLQPSSDVDVITEKRPNITASDFGVRKIDFVSAEIFDPASELGHNELKQGFLPAEKIRLRKGSVAGPGPFGNGLSEIYHGRPTAHFASTADFATTKFALDAENHPVLLALRFLRVQAINYNSSHGPGPVDEAQLWAEMDQASRQTVKDVINQALGELKPYLRHQRFGSWLNSSIQKSFSGLASPRAAAALMQGFGVENLVRRYPEEISPYASQVPISDRPAPAADKNLFIPVESEFPDGFAYHGTPTESSFRSILLQDVIPSRDLRAAGSGIYVVNQEDLEYSTQFSGRKERLVKFSVDPKARIVDITSGPGQAAWNRFVESHGRDFDAFADSVGADILKYPMAYVVKARSALGKPTGVYRQVKPFAEIAERASQSNDIQEVAQLINENALGAWETKELLRISPAFKSQTQKHSEFFKLVTRSLNEKTVLGALGRSLLSEPSLYGNKEIEKDLKRALALDWRELKKATPRRRSGVASHEWYLDREIASTILTKDYWVQNPRPIENLVGEHDGLLVRHVLSHPNWQSRPDLLLAIAQRGEEDFNLVDLILADKSRKPNFELAKALLRNGVPRIVKEIEENVFTLPQWKRYPRQIAAALKEAPKPEVARAVAPQPAAPIESVELVTAPRAEDSRSGALAHLRSLCSRLFTRLR